MACRGVSALLRGSGGRQRLEVLVSKLSVLTFERETLPATTRPPGWWAKGVEGAEET